MDSSSYGFSYLIILADSAVAVLINKLTLIINRLNMPNFMRSIMDIFFLNVIRLLFYHRNIILSARA